MSRAETLTEGRRPPRHAWNTAYTTADDRDAEAPLEGERPRASGHGRHLSGGTKPRGCARARASDLPHSGRHAARRPLRHLADLRTARRGEMARSSGWAARAERLLAARPDCVERGYLLVPSAIKAVMEGDFEKARDIFAQAVVIGERFGDQDLVNLAQQGRARAIVRLGAVDEGVALMDEVMVAVTSGELSPIIVGTIYCSVVRPASSCSTCAACRNGPRRSATGASPSPTWLPIEGSVSFDAPRVKVLRGLWPDAEDEAGMPAISSLSPRAADRQGPPTTSSRRSIDCAGSSPKRKTRTAWQATPAARLIPASPSYGSRRAVVRTRPPLSAGSWTKLAIAAPGPGFSDQPWRSSSTGGLEAEARRAAEELQRSRQPWGRRTSVPSPRGRWAPC